jgi:ribokinase
MTAPDATRPVVVVIGSVNVDLVVSVDRLPRPGETVIGGRFARHPGGKGSNQAAAAARLGARTHLVGLVGDDEFGRAARADLVEAGVDTTWLGASTHAPTGVASILVDAAAENCIAVASGANSELTPDYARRALRQLDEPYAVLVTCFEIPLDTVLAAAQEAAERGWPVVLNPAPARPVPADLLARTDLLTPNEHELQMLAGSATQLLDAGVKAVVVTQGRRGATVHTAERTWRQPAFPVQAVDTTGAGDAFTAAAAVGLARGLPLPEVIRQAAAAGALATRAAGARAALPGYDELAELLADRVALPTA